MSADGCQLLYNSHNTPPMDERADALLGKKGKKVLQYVLVGIFLSLFSSALGANGQTGANIGRNERKKRRGAIQ